MKISPFSMFKKISFLRNYSRKYGKHKIQTWTALKTWTQTNKQSTAYSLMNSRTVQYNWTPVFYLSWRAEIRMHLVVKERKLTPYSSFLMSTKGKPFFHSSDQSAEWSQFYSWKKGNTIVLQMALKSNLCRFYGANIFIATMVWNSFSYSIYMTTFVNQRPCGKVRR